MLTYVRGNIFDSPAQVLVNTVNTVGVMGKGIALTFKQIYPEMFKRYVELCESGQFDVGKLWLFRSEHKWVLNFPTKREWRKPSRLEYIEAGLERFVESYAEQNITSIAFPELGCGNGELSWTEVQPLMSKYLRSLPITVYIYRYEGQRAKPEHQELAAMREWLRSEPRSLPFEEFWSDVKATIGNGLTLNRLDSGESFEAKITSFESEGLFLSVGQRSVMRLMADLANRVMKSWRFARTGDLFIPRAAMLDLWQNIRFYGYCHAQMMPDGLDVLASYLIPILSRLEYLRPARLAIGSGNIEPAPEAALQLYIPASRQLSLPIPPQAVAA